jgi:hypothetical protein
MDGQGKGRKKYRISLILVDKETGQRRPCTLAEAQTWDWENREKVRTIGPWHIYSYDRLLKVLAGKAETGCEEIELVEKPFFMGC